MKHSKEVSVESFNLPSGELKHMTTNWFIVANTPGVDIRHKFDGQELTLVENVNYQIANKIVRAVNSHEGLVMRLKDMSIKYHEMTSHNGYFHNCGVSWCKDNFETIAKAEVKS